MASDFPVCMQRDGLCHIQRCADSLLAGPPGTTVHLMRSTENDVSGVVLKRYEGEDSLARER